MNKNKQLITPHILSYLRLKLPNFQEKKSGHLPYTCPRCKKEVPTALLLPVDPKMCDHILQCMPPGCNRRVGDIVDCVRIIETDKKEWAEDAIIDYLSKLLNLDITTQDDIVNTLSIYEKLGFSMVPLMKNQKIPIEKAWTDKEHKKKVEWEEWLSNGLNIGVRCGEISGVTVIDIDQKPIPEELQKILDKYPPLFTQETNKGCHLFYLYNENLPTTRIDELKIDILNDGKQCVISPSIIDGVNRKIKIGELVKIPDELEKFLSSKIIIKDLKTHSEQLREEIETENFKINPDDFKLKNNNLEGCCNDSFVKLGGILVKQLSTDQAGFVLRVLNKHLLEDPMSSQAINAMINSLDKFTSTDEKELALKILNYVRIVEEANSRDIMEALSEKSAEGKQRVEKAIAYLVKEGFLIKRGRIYKIIKKIEWREDWFKEGKIIDYIMPYFDDSAIFRNGDMVVIGGKQKVGKTHIALNIIKRLVKQGKKPDYISLESGSRFVIISEQLGLKEGDFRYNKEIVKPETIELDDNSITIIDWLLPNDYAETDKIFLHLSNQLKRHGGNLIIFVQLKADGSFFAENMIAMFPALLAKYLYKNEDDGVDGYFSVEYMRESKTHKKKDQIHCKYDWDSRELLRLDEIPPDKLGVQNAP
jgi:hypothetical protein